MAYRIKEDPDDETNSVLFRLWIIFCLAEIVLCIITVMRIIPREYFILVSVTGLGMVITSAANILRALIIYYHENRR
ncbi:hypothetical protein [Cloacibacillus evryensis]|uniref:hypothetical protein n=1 Tax=Cloacibacillus evryensis TaxID=508460 RepID=UPI002109B9A7|nr:hypothetical protein [Cloacibacillus evryensis]MCQ4763262.1 hypothetical protein [Cloacibacillus evryensis]